MNNNISFVKCLLLLYVQKSQDFGQTDGCFEMLLCGSFQQDKDSLGDRKKMQKYLSIFIITVPYSTKWEYPDCQLIGGHLWWNCAMSMTTALPCKCQHMLRGATMPILTRHAGTQYMIQQYNTEWEEIIQKM